MNHTHIHVTAACCMLAGLFTTGTQAHASCGSASCSLTTNWDEISRSDAGWSLDTRFSYSKADVLRNGARRITINPTDPAYAGAEVENRRTINKLVTTTLDYRADAHWGLSVQLPYVMRNHTHSIGNTNPALVGFESFDAKAIGDIKLVGRYRWELDHLAGTSMGVRLGVKLNTGRKNFVIQQTGALPAEPTLQPGNGSTDAILGSFWSMNPFGSKLSWFAQGSWESSMQHQSSFRPGDAVRLSLGARYQLAQDANALLQLGGQWLGKDSGAAAALTPAGVASSGGRFVTLTPGINYAVAPHAQLYALLQVPLYQFLNGEQLSAKYTVAGGMRLSF